MTISDVRQSYVRQSPTRVRRSLLRETAANSGSSRRATGCQNKWYSPAHRSHVGFFAPRIVYKSGFAWSRAAWPWSELRGDRRGRVCRACAAAALGGRRAGASSCWRRAPAPIPASAASSSTRPAVRVLAGLGLHAPLLHAGGARVEGFAVVLENAAPPIVLPYAEVRGGRRAGLAISHPDMVACLRREVAPRPPRGDAHRRARRRARSARASASSACAPRTATRSAPPSPWSPRGATPSSAARSASPTRPGSSRSRPRCSSRAPSSRGPLRARLPRHLGADPRPTPSAAAACGCASISPSTPARGQRR